MESNITNNNTNNGSDSDPPAANSWKGIVTESAHDSTTHGLPHIFKRKHVSIKLFWLVCFLISSGFCFYMITKSVMSYFEYETVSKVERIYEIPTLFPSVSICNLNPFTTNAAYEYVRSIFEPNNLTNYTIAVSYGGFMPVLNGLLYTLGLILRDPTYSDDYRRNMSLQIDEILISCIFNTQPCSANDFVWYYDTIYGSCFTFNSGKFGNGSDAPDKFVTKSGWLNGLMIELFIKEPNDDLSLSYLNGAHVLVHNRSTKPIFFDGFNVNVGALSLVGITREFTTRLDYPYSGCVVDASTYREKSLFVSTILDANLTYTQSECFSVCLQAYMVYICHCYVQEFPYWNKTGDRPCQTIDDINCFGIVYNIFYSLDINQICPGTCPQECDFSSIKATISAVDYPSVVYSRRLRDSSRIQKLFGNRTDVTHDELRRNTLAVNVFYSDLTYIKYSELEKLNFVDLISSIGGTLGLFLGMSFLSFVEIFDLILRLFLESCQIFMPKNNKVNSHQA